MTNSGPSELQKAGGGAEGGDLAWPKLPFLVLLGGGVLALDFLTKWWVQQNLPLARPVPILGDVFRLTHIMNPGAAFGIHVGEHSRAIFIGLTFVALIFLGGMLWYASRSDTLRLTALSLLLGGAIGNLLDRIRFPEGVIDFLDVGLAGIRWPVFNVADMGITLGAVLLAVSIWMEEKARIEDEPPLEPDGGSEEEVARTEST